MGEEVKTKTRANGSSLINMTRILSIVTATIFILHILGTSFFWYAGFWWFDIPMHILGGLWVGFLGVYFLEDKFRIINFKVHPITTLVIILGWTLFVGFMWELFEFAAGTIPAAISPLFERHVPIYQDSLWDLLNDVLGAIPAALYAWRRR